MTVYTYITMIEICEVKISKKSYKTKQGKKETIQKTINLKKDSKFDKNDKVAVLSYEYYNKIDSAQKKLYNITSKEIKKANSISSEEKKFKEELKSKNDLINDLEKQVKEKEKALFNAHSKINSLNNNILEAEKMNNIKDTNLKIANERIHNLELLIEKNLEIYLTEKNNLITEFELIQLKSSKNILKDITNIYNKANPIKRAFNNVKININIEEIINRNSKVLKDKKEAITNKLKLLEEKNY